MMSSMAVVNLAVVEMAVVNLAVHRRTTGSFTMPFTSNMPLKGLRP